MGYGDRQDVAYGTRSDTVFSLATGQLAGFTAHASPGKVRRQGHSASPPPRSMALPLLLSAALVVALAVAFVGRDFGEVARLSAATNAPLALLASVLALQRAREAPAERAGWLLMAAARGSVVLLSLLALVAPWAAVLLGGATHVLAAIAVWVWPWQRRSGDRLYHALGAALFVGSFLVLLWITGAVPRGGDPLHGAAVTAQAARFVLLDSVTLYLVSQSPRRLRTPLGWLVAGSLTTAGYLLLGRFLPPWTWALLQAIPLSFVLAGWSRRSIVAEESLDETSPWIQLVFAVPYMAVGLAVGHGFLSGRNVAAPALAFVGLTTLVLARQSLLLGEVGRARRTLESRVLDRTQALESMQAVMLKVARMNVTATLGASLVHDLNNHLQLIMGSADLLRENLEDGRQSEPELVRDLAEASSKAAELTSRVMSFIRQTPEPAAPLDLREIVGGLEPLLRTITGRALHLELDLPCQPLTVSCAAARIEQVVVNLVANARDAADRGGGIVVRLLDGGDGHALLQVVDEGAGIPVEVLPRLFEPFFTTKEPGRGTGLGLASIKVLAERDGGSVSVRSAVGRGTTFTVRWPLAAAGAA